MSETGSGRRRRLLMLLAPAVFLSACAADTMNPYVPAHCHGTAEPFHTFVLEYHDVPGFIFEVIDTSLAGALQRQGLSAAAADQADVKVVSTLEVIERNQPVDAVSESSPITGGDPFHYPAGSPSAHPMGETVAPNELHRFVTHLTVDVIDQRTSALIWTGAIDRAHAIQGGETFHNEIAVLQISHAFDEMFVGLTTPCE